MPVRAVDAGLALVGRPLLRLPIRWRLAIGSALLTLIILLVFALLVGTLTTGLIRGDFNDDVRSGADRLARELQIRVDSRGQPQCELGVSANAIARVVASDGRTICASPRQQPALALPRDRTEVSGGYRIETRQLFAREPIGGTEVPIYLQYARPVSDVQQTESRVRLFLVIGVIVGTALALLAGVAVARRAMSPIAELTATAREVERTRDPSRRMPHSSAEDEVAELAETLESMLAALDQSRTETEAALRRQREFVADASHELRTPLTSVLANLEYLESRLAGEERDAAGSALGSARRMRRLVADLLLLARADAGRQHAHEPCDLGAVLVDAASELEPVAGAHDLAVSPGRAPVLGARDELHRLALNLMENALKHTPPGTRVRAATGVENGVALLVVEDDGPGVPPQLAPRIFERFVRGGGDGTSSSGLGLAIVLAVATAHGGTVTLEPSSVGGARFVVRLPSIVPSEPASPTGAADEIEPVGLEGLWARSGPPPLEPPRA